MELKNAAVPDVIEHEAQLEILTDRDGRDEMNLSEYPIALLADRQPSDVGKTIVYHNRDETLTITGSDLLGLPLAMDIDVIIGLLYLTKIKNQFECSTVNFTRYELLKVLRWPDRGHYYKRLTESLNRWVGVTLVYKRAWWDNERKVKGNHAFHILEAASVMEQSDRKAARTQQMPLPLSTIRWSNEFFQSIKANNIKKLDLQVYFSLESSITKQLYRFLDKRFYRKPAWRFDLRTLACEHVGLSRNYETWQLKQKLKPAIDELVEIGFLKKLPPERQFSRTGKGEWSVSVERSGSLKLRAEAELEERVADEDEIPQLARELMSRGVNESQARELVASFGEDRITTQIEQFDWLRSKRPSEVKKPGGFLVTAIREGYARPEGFVSTAEREAKNAAESKARRERAVRQKQEKDQVALEERIQAQVVAYLNGLTENEKQALATEALEAADPELARNYGEGQQRDQRDFFFKPLVLYPYLRRKLGLEMDVVESTA